MSEFCNILKQLRQEKGITQKEIAKILGISQAAYSLYEKGQREPKYEMLEKIADFFNVSVGFLVSGQKDYIYSITKIPFNDEFSELFSGVSALTEEYEKKQKLKQISDSVNRNIRQPVANSTSSDKDAYTKDPLFKSTLRTEKGFELLRQQRESILKSAELSLFQGVQLLESMNSLNEEGQQKVKEYVDDLSANPRYRKDNNSERNTGNSDK